MPATAVDPSTALRPLSTPGEDEHRARALSASGSMSANLGLRSLIVSVLRRDQRGEGGGGGAAVRGLKEGRKILKRGELKRIKRSSAFKNRKRAPIHPEVEKGVPPTRSVR